MAAQPWVYFQDGGHSGVKRPCNDFSSCYGAIEVVVIIIIIIINWNVCRKLYHIVEHDQVNHNVWSTGEVPQRSKI